MSARLHSELLSLLASRKAWAGPSYTLPSHGWKGLQRIEEAAKCEAGVDDSDPWAYARTRHYLLLGYDSPSDALKDCKGRTAARATHHAEQFKEALESLKKRVDMERAWNQHKSAEYKETH